MEDNKRFKLFIYLVMLIIIVTIVMVLFMFVKIKSADKYTTPTYRMRQNKEE